MSFALIPTPPQVPSDPWLREFAAAMIAIRPTLSHDNAMRCAALAHAGTWLLEPGEAAQLWLLAIEASRTTSTRPRGFLS
jgi:hypothetical protein